MQIKTQYCQNTNKCIARLTSLRTFIRMKIMTLDFFLLNKTWFTYTYALFFMQNETHAKFLFFCLQNTTVFNEHMKNLIEYKLYKCIIDKSLTLNKIINYVYNLSLKLNI